MKMNKPQMEKIMDAGTGRTMSKKHSSHGTFRANRKPNSKRVRNGQVKPMVS